MRPPSFDKKQAGAVEGGSLIWRHRTWHESMRDILILIEALVALGGGGRSSVTAPQGSAAHRDSALRRELLAMVDAYQRVRKGFSLQMEPKKVAEVRAIDAKHTARMKAIVAQHGWPGRALVGDDGAHAAWLLVQHSEMSFMAQCLPMMERAVSTGEASPTDYAYLLDRVRTNQGKPQVYG